MTKTALIIVDVQNDFLPGGSMAVENGTEIIPIINRLTTLPFNTVVATKDWHPSNHVSFAINHHKQPGDVVDLHGNKQILWPVHCIQEHEGAKFHRLLDTSRFVKIFYKGTNVDVDSYSTFFDNDHVSSTQLEGYLKENNIKRVFIAGLTTDYCVKYSVLDALMLGFTVYVVIDACKPVNLTEGDEKNAIQEMQSKGAHVIYFKDVQELLSS